MGAALLGWFEAFARGLSLPEAAFGWVEALVDIERRVLFGGGGGGDEDTRSTILRLDWDIGSSSSSSDGGDEEGRTLRRFRFAGGAIPGWRWVLSSLHELNWREDRQLDFQFCQAH